MKEHRWLTLGFAGFVILVLFVGVLSLPSERLAAFSDVPPVELTGTTFVRGELIDTGYIFSAEELNYCITKATLVHLDGEQYELRVNEEDCGPRLSIWDLNITDEGEVSGTYMTEILYPEQETGSMIGELWLFTGCMMVGDFPALEGTWDGENLEVQSTFGGRCHAGKYWGDPEIMAMFSGDSDPEGPMANGLDWDDGPTYVEFGADLVAVE